MKRVKAVCAHPKWERAALLLAEAELIERRYREWIDPDSGAEDPAETEALFRERDGLLEDLCREVDVVGRFDLAAFGDILQRDWTVEGRWLRSWLGAVFGGHASLERHPAAALDFLRSLLRRFGGEGWGSLALSLKTLRDLNWPRPEWAGRRNGEACDWVRVLRSLLERHGWHESVAEWVANVFVSGSAWIAGRPAWAEACTEEPLGAV